MSLKTVAIAERKHHTSQRKYVLGVYEKPEDALPLLRERITDGVHSGIVCVYAIGSTQPLQRYQFNREQGVLEQIEK